MRSEPGLERAAPGPARGHCSRGRRAGHATRLAEAVLLLACLLSGWAWAALDEAYTPRDPYTHFFEQTFGDFQEELQRAREEGKLGVLLFFEQEECPFCHRMKDTVLNRPDVQAWFRARFLAFAVDIEGDMEITDFRGRAMTMKTWSERVHRVRATPVFLFVDLEGRPVARYTGATSGPEEFLLLGRYVAERAYERMSFARYKRMMRRRARGADEG